MNTYKNFKLAGLILVAVLTANVANASLLIEPHIGYNLHASGTALSHEYNYKGNEYGSRFGFQTFGFMAGMDYTHSSMDLEDRTVSSTDKRDYQRNEVGVFAGYNLPILLRAWGAYYFKSKAKADNGDYLKGNTFELGLGFTPLPLLSVNLMVRLVNWDERSIGGVTSTPSLSTNEIVLGVSLPLNVL